MIKYPHYLAEPNARTHFRLAVLHRLLMENTESPARVRRHAFNCGWWAGRLSMFKATFWRDDSIDREVYAEAFRLFHLLGIPKPENKP